MRRRKGEFKVGLVQLNSDTRVEENLARAERFVRRAAGLGAELVALPENFAYLRDEGSPLAFRAPLAGPFVDRIRGWAQDNGVWLLAGSFPERLPRRRKVANTSLLIDDRGRVRAVYRKIHLFDIDIRGGAVFRESKTVAAGDRPVVADTPFGRLGMTICYDLRFPELYRRLAEMGAQLLCVPSAFTAFTGRAHWLALLRARAIENLCWVVAPGQTGRHSPQRASFGHSVVFDPWGERVALKRSGEGVLTARVDLARIDEVRAGLPARRHVRRDLFPP